MSAPKYGIIIIPNKRKQGEAENAPPFVLLKGEGLVFKESEHPRDAEGKFVKGAGNGDDPDPDEIAKEIFPHLREGRHGSQPPKQPTARKRGESVDGTAVKSSESGLTLSVENDIIATKKADFKRRFEAGEISTYISPQKQARHQRGSREFNEYQRNMIEKGRINDKPSYIREDWTTKDLERFVVSKLKGDVVVKSDGSFEEYVKCDEIVGYYYSPSKNGYIPTRCVKVKYSLGVKNIHIIPVKEKGE